MWPEGAGNAGKHASIQNPLTGPRQLHKILHTALTYLLSVNVACHLHGVTRYQKLEVTLVLKRM